MGGDRRSIGKTRLGAHVEDRPFAVFGVFDRMGDKAVHRVRLVQRPGHQRVEEHGRQGGGIPLEDIGREAVESAEPPGRECPAFRRLRVHIIEMGEALGIFQIPKGGNAMGADDPLLGAEGRHGRQNKQACHPQRHQHGDKAGRRGLGGARGGAAAGPVQVLILLLVRPVRSGPLWSN